MTADASAARGAPDGPRVLVTGASGFVGGHVVAAARAVPGLRLRLMTHRTALAPAVVAASGNGPGNGSGDGSGGVAGVGIETVHGDLADPETLRGSCEGVDALIHCASEIGHNEPTARSVNDQGTRALVEEAVRRGVPRIVQLSTASVYGRGPFVRLRPGDAEPAPASVTSLTRAAAERHVLAAGGVVVRPHIVYGAGDRWAVPGLVGLLGRLAAVPAGCGARHSMIEAGALGRALLGAALSRHDPAGVYHVNHPEPVSCSQLLAAVVDGLGLPWGAERIGPAEARERLADVPYALHHFGMLTVDHWFADDRAGRDLDWEPGEGFTTAFARHAAWYRGHLDSLRRAAPGTAPALVPTRTPGQ
ncbi:NAD-dependent epimerase/dehydratase family protein [Streptomyces sp. PTD5-9]|uniref:NAD-dependent epimerase/dehydratase family protein n=1 Tax=Streptomyces sp. PTD5-9 TaxID=3120150 RepID=UPI003009A824